MMNLCKFFSAISNGKGKVLFFKLEEIEKIQKEGNPKQYEFNSHTSIADYNGIKAENEDKWNKWEYNPETKELKIDGEYVAKDDSKTVKRLIEKYLNDNNAIYCMKRYNQNTGDWNTGNRNTGDWNTGNRNTGDWNTGDRNIGNWNTGDRNIGNRNTGNWNTGNWNTGNLNTDEPPLRIFNKETKLKIHEIRFPKYFFFEINKWIEQTNMTDDEKKQTTEGYLRKIDYKEAWKASFDEASKEDVALTLKLPNFDYKIFEEISGITKKMIQDKLK